MPSGKLRAVNSSHVVCYDPDSGLPVIGMGRVAAKANYFNGRYSTKLGTDLMFTMMVMQRLDIRGSTVV